MTYVCSKRNLSCYFKYIFTPTRQCKACILIRTVGKMVILLRYVVVLFIVFKQLQAVVQFNFSTSELVISEGGDLPSQLSIVKTGQHQGNITVDIELTSTVPNDGDYTINQIHYVFTSETFTLPVGIRLIGDRSGEDIESFNVALVLPQQSISADIVSPGNVTVVIIDDDSVVIGFSNDNSSVTMIEGDPPQTICLEVKEQGLRLDPFDMVPINIMIESEIPGTPVELGNSQLVFERTLIRCTTISTPDNALSDGTRSSHVVINSMDSNVPIKIYPRMIPLTILDNDQITFTISSDAIIVASEGQRVIRIIKFLKTGNTSLTYNVTLKINALTSSASFNDLSIPTVLLFNPSTYEIDVPVEVYVLDDSESSEERKEFSISVSIKAINATGTLTTLEGGPIEITVYDNDFEVGFIENRTNITEGFYRRICVRIFNIINTRDIDPTMLILLELKISPNTTAGSVELTKDRIILNALSPVVCFDVILSTNGVLNDIASFNITLLTPANQDTNYNIRFRQQLIVVEVLQQPPVTMVTSIQESLSSSGVAAITVLTIMLFISLALNVTVTAALLIIIRMNKRKVDDDSQDSKTSTEKRTSYNNSTRQSTSPEQPPGPVYENVNPKRRISQANLLNN